MARQATYNGHRNWNYWNVSLWIGNDEGLYREALCEVRRNDTRTQAARALLGTLHDTGVTQTPDGAPYTMGTIRAAMADMD